MLCGIGSMMIAATSWSVSARSTAAASLNAHDDRRVGDLGEDAAREQVLRPDLLRRRDDVHRDRVVPAVVAALELEDVAPAGDRARQAQRVEGRLAAGRGQEHLLEGRDDVDEALGELDLDRGHADAHQVDRPPRGGDRAVDVGVVVPEERRPECGVVVGVRDAVRVREGRSARRGDDEVLEARHPALAAVDPAGDDRRGARGQLGGELGGGEAHPATLSDATTSSSSVTPMPGAVGTAMQPSASSGSRSTVRVVLMGVSATQYSW